MDFEKTCMLFAMKEPYYGILLSSMERFPSRQISTMGVTQSGNVFRLLYNPDWVEPLDTNTVLELLKHEILHIAFNHFSLFESEPKSEQEGTLRNIAADMEINGYLDLSRLESLHPVTASLYGWDDRLGTREYFHRLVQKEENRQRQSREDMEKPDTDVQQLSGNGEMDEDYGDSVYSTAGGGAPCVTDGSGDSSSDRSSSGRCPQCLDDHSVWPRGTESEMQSLTQQIEDMLVFAADEVEKSGRGTVPGVLEGKIRLIRERKRPKPAADWKRYCRRYLGNSFSEMTRRTIKRPSRRFEDASGTRRQRKSRILVAIDTSGSISMKEYNEFFAQLDTLVTTADFHVLECDARIQHEYEYRGKPNSTLHGGGGTSFQPSVDYFLKHRKEYDTLVYFTDGDAPIPKNTPKDTLWVISSQGNQDDRERYRVNGASVAFIPKTKQ